jgi:hypothetical protein
VIGFLVTVIARIWLVRPGRADFASARLDAGVEASGPHDFAVRDPSTPKASSGLVPVRRSFSEGGTAPFVSMPLTAHGPIGPALRFAFHADAAASTASHPHP